MTSRNTWIIAVLTVLASMAVCAGTGALQPAGDTDRRPHQYLLRQILLEPSVSTERREEVRERALRCLRAARQGADFADLARRYSEEPGAGRTGGDLGYFSYDDMVEPFSRATFTMDKGDIAGPVETQFGFHIIKVIDSDGEKRRARHILFSLTPGREDTLAVLDTLAVIRKRLLGGAGFGDMLRAYCTEPTLLETGGYMVWQTPDAMLPSFAGAVRGLDPGDVSEPFQSVIGFHIVKVDSINYSPDVVFKGFPPRIRERLDR